MKRSLHGCVDFPIAYSFLTEAMSTEFADFELNKIATFRPKDGVSYNGTT